MVAEANLEVWFSAGSGATNQTAGLSWIVAHTGWNDGIIDGGTRNRQFEKKRDAIRMKS